MENEDKLSALFEEALNEIKESSTYKDLIAIRKKIELNDEITSLVAKIKDLQKNIVALEVAKKSTTKEEKELALFQEKLFSIPIYNEYYYLNEEIQIKLDTITKTVELAINKIIS